MDTVGRRRIRIGDKGFRHGDSLWAHFFAGRPHVLQNLALKFGGLGWRDDLFIGHLGRGHCHRLDGFCRLLGEDETWNDCR